MILHEYPPPPALADTVSSITVLRVDRLPEGWVIPLVAKAAPSIVYQSSGDGARLALYGQNVAPYLVRASGHLLLCAWFLHPHRLRPLFGFRASEATEKCIDLSFLPAVKHSCLMERLAASGHSEEGMRLLEGLIRALCADPAGEDSKVAGHAARIIAGRSGRVALRSLQEELRTTERSFQRLFEAQIGVSPKVFSRICQFQPAFRQLSQGQFSKLSDIAYDNGYADQSHLIRAFREFTGLTPGEYLERTTAFLAAVGGEE